jgi:hypothetical protein
MQQHRGSGIRERIEGAAQQAVQRIFSRPPKTQASRLSALWAPDCPRSASSRSRDWRTLTSDTSAAAKKPFVARIIRRTAKRRPIAA